MQNTNTIIYTISEAAKYVGTSKGTIAMACQEGRLACTRHNDIFTGRFMYLIKDTDLQKYLLTYIPKQYINGVHKSKIKQNAGV